MSTAAHLDWSDPHLINADLHCHSTTSDGTLSPEELAARAAANGVQIWSLTDHDEVGGLARAANTRDSLEFLENPFFTQWAYTFKTDTVVVYHDVQDYQTHSAATTRYKDVYKSR